jgi:YD repeat-containing protein
MQNGGAHSQELPDRTTWQYDLVAGLLTNKVYADGKGTTYAYTQDGKLSRRTWARGVTTTYSYDGVGQMTNINYSGSTPDVSFAFNRLGQQTAITDGQGTRTFTYNATLQLAAETNTLGAITRKYDSLGRSAGFEAGSDYSVSYGYDPVGRFASVSNTINHQPSTIAHYSYLPGSDLLVSLSNTVGGALCAATTRTYEPNRNLITRILNTAGTNSVSQFDYVNDAVGRRTRRVDSASVTNAFDYNARSELIDALMGTNSHSYRYDPIGNRQTASNDTEVLTYAANALNQYTNIADGVTNAPQYDLDGNLVAYAGWTFSWDAENRLVLASNATTVVSNSYDYMSRRIGKSVYTNDSGSWILASGFSFTYDGWAMIRELVTRDSSLVTNSYLYGLDLSGSLQGAGTIGGILSTCLNGTNAFYAYDANGNLSDLVGRDGSAVAHYEYDPYGTTSAKSGLLADANPFRFSTKYFDAETGLYYYGLRFSSPGTGRSGSFAVRPRRFGRRRGGRLDRRRDHGVADDAWAGLQDDIRLNPFMLFSSV